MISSTRVARLLINGFAKRRMNQCRGGFCPRTKQQQRGDQRTKGNQAQDRAKIESFGSEVVLAVWFFTHGGGRDNPFLVSFAFRAFPLTYCLMDSRGSLEMGSMFFIRLTSSLEVRRRGGVVEPYYGYGIVNQTVQCLIQNTKKKKTFS